MNILIIGGVAAGTKVAAKLKRENRNDNKRLSDYNRSCGLNQ